MQAIKLNITQDINEKIRDAVKISIHNSNKETFRVLNDFIRQIIDLSISNKSLDDFCSYINIFPYYYYVSFDKVLPNSVEFSKYCSDLAGTSLRDIIRSSIHFSIKQDERLENINVLNDFSYFAFQAFGWLFFRSIQRKDYQQFHFFIEQFDLINVSQNSEVYKLKFDLRDLRRKNLDGSLNSKISEIQRELAVFGYFQTKRRHVLLGIKSWIIYLFDLGLIDPKAAVDSLKLIRIPNSVQNPVQIDHPCRLKLTTSDRFKLTSANRFKLTT